ncbi:GHMP family kinase ATP-binding protein [Pectinatus haikarae]|uniref:L-threonine kinase n=1 Tax=Pectinatus haikarae TaxID=349096 RepID=A0ABT9Y699_9FIRM|nr:hypothetical protein [Pectinatus haikarae]MDQ0203231.1 L-threonine kinase [Pectinatus haikarae]
MTVSVKVPGACGELVQGVADGIPFLVTCPINMWSTAAASVKEHNEKIALKEKAAHALNMVCERFALDKAEIAVSLTSQLLRSKGMSSSSADIAAVCKAAALLQGKNPTEAQIAKLAAEIEPTDGVFCRGIVKFNHLTGDILEYLGEPPPVKILVFDCGGKVDTVVFNQRGELPQLNEEKEKQVKKAFELVAYGIKYKDAEALGAGTTISAIANQHILYKEDLADVIEIVKKYKGTGINIAHSGTLIGAIFTERENAEVMRGCVEAIRKRCPYTTYLFSTELVSGGFFYGGGKRINSI